jgi:carbamoyltransferase
MKIVATSLCHDGSACFLEDGQIKYWNKQERLSRVKRDSIPFMPLMEIERNFDLSHLDFYASATPFQEIPLDLFPEAAFFNWASVASPFFNYFRSTGKKCSFRIMLSHHLTHAACAFYSSGFDSAYVLVVDRNGSIFLDVPRRAAFGVETETLYYCRYPSEFEIVYRNPPHWVGITGIYALASEKLGIGQLENGKTMGLAAYGKEREGEALFRGYVPASPSVAGPITDGRSLTRMTLDTAFRQQQFEHLLPPWIKNEDLAYMVQKQTSQAILRLIEEHVNINRCDNLCFTGGHAHNCLLNYEIVNRFSRLNFYPDPLADDSGTSYGAAMYCWFRETQSTQKMPLLDIYRCGLPA